MDLYVLGLALGLLIGATGVGAGSLTAPLLVFLGMPAPMAVGTDLVYAAITRLAGAAAGAAAGQVDRVWLTRLGLPGIVGAVAGGLIGRLLPEAVLSQVVLHALAAVLMAAALAALIAELSPSRQAVPWGKAHPLGLMLAGAAVGLTVGLTSVGGGSLGILLLANASSLPQRKVVATSLSIALLLSLAGAAVHLIGGGADLGVAGKLLVGSIPGAVIGSFLSGKLPARPVRFGVALLLLISGVRLAV